MESAIDVESLGKRKIQIVLSGPSDGSKPGVRAFPGQHRVLETELRDRESVAPPRMVGPGEKKSR
jgi:hypothetical protein